MTELKRQILDKGDRDNTTAALQACLYDLIDLALQGKQAHWNLVGSRFRSVHLQLDEIIASVRAASDDVAERIATLGVAADGRATPVGSTSRLEGGVSGLQTVESTVKYYADRLATAISGLRVAIETLAEVDPISEDLLVGISAGLEKHLWMLQTQEV